MLWELWPCLLFALCVLRGRCDLLFKLWSFVDMPTEVIEFSTGIYILVYMYLYIFQVIYNTFSLFARTFSCDLISYMKLVCLYLRMWCPQWTDKKLTQVPNIPTEKFMPIMIFCTNTSFPTCNVQIAKTSECTLCWYVRKRLLYLMRRCPAEFSLLTCIS